MRRVPKGRTVTLNPVRKEAAMNALMLVPLAALVLAVRSVHLRWRLAAWECVWHVRHGLVTVDLRRDAHLARLGSDSQEFPQPREFRVLATCVAGLPMWSRQSIVSLPAEAEGWIAGIGAADFDHLFDEPFRLSSPQRRVRLAARAH
jgi:hypothetical protein